MKKLIYIFLFISVSISAQKISNNGSATQGQIDYSYYGDLALKLSQLEDRIKILENIHNSEPQELKAFPTAEGFGRYATGGRGGVVIKVTNLNDKGFGSLRAALEDSRTRTIVFEVGGTINLASHIYVKNGNLTLAGQTALGDGILIKGASIQIESSNVIIRYFRIRPGTSAPSGSDALNITAWGGKHHKNIIIDHASLSWAKDEAFDIRAVSSGTVDSVTIQNSIISESSKGLLGGQNTFNKSYINNLFAHNSERNIRTNYPKPDTFDFEMINNLIYGFKYATIPSLGSKFAVVQNKYKVSSQTTMLSGAIVEGSGSGQGTPSQTHAFIKDNIIPIGKKSHNSSLNNYIKTTPYKDLSIIPGNIQSIESQLLEDVGCSYPKRDLVDLRVVDQYNNSNGITISSGVYPTINGGTKLLDTDNDGMPDIYEDVNNLNKNNPDDRNNKNSTGYTNLEIYLNNLIK